jgi:hypothetical protein
MHSMRLVRLAQRQGPRGQGLGEALSGGLRQRATELRDEYVARAALRSWVPAVVGREGAAQLT